MKNTLHIIKKELGDFFVSPIAYIVITIFLMVTGWFFFLTFFLQDQANLRGFFSLLPIIFSFIIPAVTMRLFSEEKSKGTYELIRTMPVTLNNIILGKFFAALIFIGAMLLPTLAYPITVMLIGSPDPGPIIGGYLGALMLGGSFAAIGIFSSSLTKNQIIAFIIGMVICFALTLLDKMLIFLPQSAVVVLGTLGADFHFQNIAKGIVDTRDVLYFVSIAVIALFGTHLVMEETA